MKARLLVRAGAVALVLLALAACQPGAPTGAVTPRPTTVVVETQPVAEATHVEPTAASALPTATTEATSVPPTGVPAATPAPEATATAIVEERVVELEWPPRMRLGDSDVIRLALAPSADGLEITAEFVDHQVVTETVPVVGVPGFDLLAVARLDATGMDVAPQGDQAQTLLLGQPATWRWSVQPRTAGTHRLALVLRLRWVPQAGHAGTEREATLFSRTVSVEVLSILGLTTREVTMLAIAGLFVGGSLSLPLAAQALRPGQRVRAVSQAPNAALALEQPAGLKLSPAEVTLLRALFRSYGRLIVAKEFLSGYSGARTLLAQPIRPDGRADAYTIAKIGQQAAIEREYANYEAYVKDTLPPVTARIQSPPVRAALGRGQPGAGLAALRYTFIGEPGHSPISLRQALLADPDPALLEKLFATFGPNWWMQRRPYTFRLAQEYDRMLPPHLVIEPLQGHADAARRLDGRTPPAEAPWEVGDVVVLRHLRVEERRPDGRSLALVGAAPAPGQPRLRVRWLGLQAPRGAVGRVTATRASLLRDLTASFDRCGLPDPLARLPALLAETVRGTQSTIHGDLNPENMLVGPGGFVWLIDFARTRDGHTLFDFAHLEAGLLAHVIAPAISTDEEFVRVLAGDDHPLLRALHELAARCLFNPNQPREYALALYAACLGGLKFSTLTTQQKHRLYLAAAFLSQRL